MEKVFIRVLIAEDHTLFRNGIRALLAAAGDIQVVDEATSGVEIVSKTEAIQPDVLLLSESVSELNSFEAVRSIRQVSAGTRIVLMVTSDWIEASDLMLDTLGADCILKNSPPQQIVAKVRSAALDARELTTNGLSRLSNDLEKLSNVNNGGWPRQASLTPREREVLKLLAEGGTAREIAEHLSLSVKTIEAHKFNLMRKLDIHNRAELVDYVLNKQQKNELQPIGI